MTSCAEAVSRSAIAVVMAQSLDGAFSLAADHLEWPVAAPVDELVHRLEVELDRHRQVLDARLELLGSDPPGERVELLAVVALGLVIAHPTLDCVGNPLCRKARLEPLPIADVAALIGSADVGDVCGDGVLTGFDRGAIEADVGDVVLSAAVRAAAHLDVDPPR